MDIIIEKKKWTAKKIITIAAIIIFSFFLVYLMFLRDKSSKFVVDKNQLTIVEVRKDKFQEFIPVEGTVMPKTTYYIDAIQGGVVEAIYSEDGAIVSKGDTLLKLLNTAMELSYMEQETRMLAEINNLQNTKLSLEQNKFLRQKEIVQLQYQIDLTERDFERKVELYDGKVISDKEFEDAKRDYEYTLKQLNISIELQRIDSISRQAQKRDIQRSLERMEANMKLLRKNIENAYVKSPADGKLSAFNLEIGQTKSAGEHLGQIDVQEGFRLEARIDERYVSRVSIGQPAELEYNGSVYHLTVSKIYTNVSNGTIKFDLLFDDDIEPKAIKRGQSVQLKLILSGATDALIIKKGSFFQETGGNWIYVLDESGEFAYKRPIKINRQNTSSYELNEGLNEGEKVIVSSYSSFDGKDKIVFK